LKERLDKNVCACQEIYDEEWIAGGEGNVGNDLQKHESVW